MSSLMYGHTLLYIRGNNDMSKIIFRKANFLYPRFSVLTNTVSSQCGMNKCEDSPYNIFPLPEHGYEQLRCVANSCRPQHQTVHNHQLLV